MSAREIVTDLGPMMVSLPAIEPDQSQYRIPVATGHGPEQQFPRRVACLHLLDEGSGLAHALHRVGVILLDLGITSENENAFVIGSRQFAQQEPPR
jgi:hypothetical protein